MHFLIIFLLLILSGCTHGLNDVEAPKILGVSIEANDICNKGGKDVPCMLRSDPSDVITVKVRIQGSDDVGIAGYYITSGDALIPANWITIAPAGTTYDETITYSLPSPSGDGIKKIKVWIKDLGGKISDVTTAEVLLVSGQIKKGWKKETIDGERDFANGLFSHALLVDSNGYPNIVFGENKLYHAVQDATGWTIEKLDDIDIGGSHAGTSFDSSGNVHLSYIDGNKNLIYATNSSGAWKYTTVDSSGHVSGIPDIDYSTAGVHISYYDAGGRDLRYVNCVSDCSEPVNWTSKVLDSTGDVGNHSSIKTGTDGSVHISYFDNTNNSLKYVTADSNGTWGTPVTVDNNSGDYSDIALDSNNKPHIVYYDTTGILRYASVVSGNWEPAELDKDSFTANFLSITVDAGDIVHISYFDTKTSVLKYATNETGSWVTVSLDTVGTSGLYNLIAADSDNIHISYFDSTNLSVKYAVCTGSCTDASNWSIERVLSSGDAGRHNSIAMDADGNLHVSYLGGGALRYAENTTGTWRTAVVGRNGSSSGEYTSMAIDSGGNIHIGYYDNDINGLKYAVCKNNCVKPENWTSTIIEMGLPGNISFSHVSLITDEDDGIHISYYDISSGSLKYAFCNTGCTVDNGKDGIGDNWKRVFVDKSVIVNNIVIYDVGQYSSIAIDKSANKIYMSYFERIKGSLMIAVCGGSCIEDGDGDGIGDNWTTEVIDEGKKEPVSGAIDARGLYTSVKVDQDGYVHISYFNETTGDLKYATNRSGGWDRVVVDNYDRAGIHSALSIGTDNKVYIVYNRISAGLSVLKYAVCSLNLNCTSDNVENITRNPEKNDGIADNWTTYILDMFDNPGMFTSIIADSDIHVIYYNPDTGGLNYTSPPSSPLP
ncbi:MAG: hypothetical protein HZA08_09575 [Nitrospirae bacterium]|nr:hypothetical protein [Nitrospirota bacterium]